MPALQAPGQTKQEILQQRLKKQTSLSWNTWSPLGVGLVVAGYFAPGFLSRRIPINPLPVDFCIGFYVILFSQLFLLLWTAILRFIKPEENPGAAKICFWLHVLFIIGWPYLIIKAAPAEQFLAFAELFFIWICLMMDFTITNRLILACHNPGTRAAEQLASPCPEMFRRWQMFRSLLFTPVIAPIIFGGGGLLVCLVAGEPFSTIKTVTVIGSLFGLLTGIIMAPLALPFALIKQCANPSYFQQVLRNWFSDMVFKSKYLPEETMAFRWWLSHPGEPWPENMKDLCRFIDTSAFDWQDPAEWIQPLKKAAQQYQNGLIKSTTPLPTFVIGEQANEADAEIANEPVTKITPLFQAVIQNDLPTLQQLLPQHPLELNRPFLATGNTLLHVAALNGYTEIVRLLLAQPGIDKARKNNDGKTAADLAQEKGFAEIAHQLQ